MFSDKQHSFDSTMDTILLSIRKHSSISALPPSIHRPGFTENIHELIKRDRIQQFPLNSHSSADNAPREQGTLFLLAVL
jgi:hypothetical protein